MSSTAAGDGEPRAAAPTAHDGTNQPAGTAAPSAPDGADQQRSGRRPEGPAHAREGSALHTLKRTWASSLRTISPIRRPR